MNTQHLARHIVLAIAACFCLQFAAKGQSTFPVTGTDDSISITDSDGGLNLNNPSGFIAINSDTLCINSSYLTSNNLNINYNSANISGFYTSITNFYLGISGAYLNISNDSFTTNTGYYSVYSSGGIDLTGQYLNITSYSDASLNFLGNLNLYTAEGATISSGGPITIDTDTLSVTGTIFAADIVVGGTSWADYVFDADYQLPSLDAVEQHIKAEKHLPGIPSARDIAAKGVSLGDMQALLLAKIEELTLHQIEMDKRLKAQDGQIRELRAENEQLRQQSK